MDLVWVTTLGHTKKSNFNKMYVFQNITLRKKTLPSLSLFEPFTKILLSSRSKSFISFQMIFWQTRKSLLPTYKCTHLHTFWISSTQTQKKMVPWPLKLKIYLFSPILNTKYQAISATNGWFFTHVIHVVL